MLAVANLRNVAASGWRTPNVWKIALSAFFADFGYQAVLSGFPLFLILVLKAPVWAYGVAMALSYGPGAVVAYLGGRWGDRSDHRKVAIFGNLMIPFLSLSALVVVPWQAITLFVIGWLSRNLRSPSRRVLLTKNIDDQHRSHAFGFLHGLDVGGGMLAAIGLLVLLSFHVTFRWIFVFTIIPLMVSSALLIAVKPRAYLQSGPSSNEPPSHQAERNVRGVLIAAAVYGFSSYSMGFPIITVAQSSKSAIWGVLTYIIFLGVSALTGFGLGHRLKGSIRELAWLGYLVAAIGSIGLAAAYAWHGSVITYYVPIALLGFALGAIETLEPTLISRYTSRATSGGGMGKLTAARSVGLFLANLVMGLLYHVTPVAAYGYAAILAVVAVVVLLLSTRSR